MALNASRPVSRRTMMRLLAAGGLSTPALGALIEACSSGNQPPARHTVTYALSVEPDALNPPIATSSVSGTVMSLVFAGLLRLKADGSFEDNLAQSHETLDGGMTYRFTLRRDLVWEDGTPLTSADFAFTHRTYVDPRTKAVSTAGWDEIDRVDTPDPSTIVVHMKRPFGSFPLHVGCALVLPQHALSTVADFSKAPFNRQPLGCGPFKVKQWDAASQIVLVANDPFFRGRPHLNEFVFKMIPDPTTQLNELRTGEVDVVNFNAPNLWRQAKASGAATTTYDGTTYVMAQYVQYGALKDVRVRQALDYATPKHDIVKSVLSELATVAYADVPPSSPYYDPHVEHHDYKLATAAKLLDQAGFTLRNKVRVDAAGNPLSVPIYTLPTLPTYVRIAQILQQNWQKLGVQTAVVTQDYNTIFGNAGPLWKGQDAALIYGWGQGTDPYNFINWSSTQIPSDENAPGENLGRYVNNEMDDLVVKGGLTVDLAARKQVYDRTQSILAHDVPVTFLYWPMQLYAYASWLEGFAPSAFTGPLWNVETWE